MDEDSCLNVQKLNELTLDESCEEAKVSATGEDDKLLTNLIQFMFDKKNSKQLENMLYFWLTKQIDLMYLRKKTI